jgi:hypothetical protein
MLEDQPGDTVQEYGLLSSQSQQSFEGLVSWD